MSQRIGKGLKFVLSQFSAFGKFGSGGDGSDKKLQKMSLPKNR